MAMAVLIDPTVAGKYPVILGDGLLDRTSDGIFTGIRYNHKPALSSDDAPNNARLKPSLPGKTDSYDLSFTDDDGAYAYTGSRNTNSNQYVLHFDPERKAFILDKIDSTFNMNITRTPSDADAERLRSQYPHLDSQPSPQKRATAKKTGANKETATSKSSQQQAKEPKRKTEKQQQKQKQKKVAKEVALSFPEPQKEKPKPPKPPKSQSQSFEDEEEEDDDDDGGLLIEYPGGDAAKQADFSPAFPPPRRFDDFMDQRDSEADDADGESDDEPDMDFKLPSPVNNHLASSHSATVAAESMMDYHRHAAAEAQDDDDDDDEDGMNDMEDDLEKDMEMAFEDMANTPGGDESEISEED
ncbi:hypothetical protein E4U43_005668 [Claviceps pusilla]|uniref:Transcription elongation factor Eaf N-terminal domain-containing protein n=1 Tax=Claviceps pusilla TaxID=123648 RepID=A0A9P7N1S2_9HYPO|nr:hypothetical protein E4U43_005668 [Claviceps pusilla]